MTATFTVNGPNLTITFAYTGPVQLITDIANDAAHQLYNQQFDPPPAQAFDALSNAQKLAILDTFVSTAFVTLAKQYYVDMQTNAARIAAQTAAAAGLSLPPQG